MLWLKNTQSLETCEDNWLDIYKLVYILGLDIHKREYGKNSNIYLKVLTVHGTTIKIQNDFYLHEITVIINKY